MPSKAYPDDGICEREKEKNKVIMSPPSRYVVGTADLRTFHRLPFSGLECSETSPAALVSVQCAT